MITNSAQVAQHEADDEGHGFFNWMVERNNVDPHCSQSNKNRNGKVRRQIAFQARLIGG